MGTPIPKSLSQTEIAHSANSNSMLPKSTKDPNIKIQKITTRTPPEKTLITKWKDIRIVHSENFSRINDLIAILDQHPFSEVIQNLLKNINITMIELGSHKNGGYVAPGTKDINLYGVRNDSNLVDLVNRTILHECGHVFAHFNLGSSEPRGTTKLHPNMFNAKKNSLLKSYETACDDEKWRHISNYAHTHQHSYFGKPLNEDFAESFRLLLSNNNKEQRDAFIKYNPMRAKALLNIMQHFGINIKL